MFKHSIRAKLIAPFIAGTLALTLFLAWYAYSSARKAVEDAMLLMSEAKSRHAITSMGLLTKSSTTSVQNMVVDAHVTALFAPEAGPNTVKRTGEWLETITLGNEYYRDILVVNQKGVCVASSNPGHIGHSYADRAVVRNALMGVFNLGELTVGRVTKKFSAYSAGPVDAEGKVVGALVLINDFPKIVDYDEKKLFDTQTIFTAMLTPGGLFIAHKDNSLMGNTKTLFPDLYTELARSGEQGGYVKYSLQGVSYVGYAIVDPVSKWLVVTSGKESEVFASAYRIGVTVLALSFGFLCLISLVVFRFANGILSSLLSLISYAKDVSEGDFSHRLEDTSREDELGVLHTSLQRLVDALQSMLVETQEASKMKGQFLANMSHEIRTPLNAIIGMAHLSLREADLPPKQRDYLEKIRTAARSLLGLINDILDLSKVEAGMLELEDSVFNLRETMNNLISIHQDSAASKGLNLTLEYPEGLPANFIGDPLRIGQVVNNIISNAIKFTAEGGITVRVGCDAEDVAETGNEPGESLMRVSVTDTGIGIAKDVQKKLFQPFTQADASTSRQFGGTGLGLAISRKLVELLGGDFTVESVLGEGTTFSFTMRLKMNPNGGPMLSEEAALDEAFANLDIAGKRILIAEDNAINQLIIQELIAPSGVVVVMADNGQQAVNAVRTQKFDLVFMDMQMPVMDGLKATKIIRTFSGMDDLPIIAVTANAMKEDKAKGFASGMNDYITKPVEPLRLLEVLRFWLAEGGQK
ncbi:MAG: Sensor histidine kinase RcsC [Desulfovibrio sp.]